MKRTAFLITVLVIIALAGGYFAYDKYLNKKPTEVWALVPADALMVFEKQKCEACVTHALEGGWWQVIEQMITYKKSDDSLRSAVGRSAVDARVFLVSAHVTRKDDFDLVYYINDDKAVDALQHNIPSVVKRSVREFNGVQIQELRMNASVFSVAQIDDFWVGSFAPVLIEDVIRTYRLERSAFRKDLLSGERFTTIAEDAGNVYVNHQLFSDFLGVFSNELLLNRPAGKVSVLDVKPDDHALVLNGFTRDTTSSFLSIFSRQSAAPLKHKSWISNRTMAASSYEITDRKAFVEDLLKVRKSSARGLMDSLEVIAKASGVKSEFLYNSLKSEIVLNHLERQRGADVTKIFIVEVENGLKFKQSLDAFGNKYSVDTVFMEYYGQYEIREVPVYRFLEKAYWPLVTGFVQSYYTIKDNLIIFADDLEELKTFLNDIDSDETWGRSVGKNKFLESTLLESTVSFYFNPTRLLSWLRGSLQPRWQSFVRDHGSEIRRLDLSAIQFSNLNREFYTNAVFTFGDPLTTSEGSTRSITKFERPLQRLFSVRSHVNRDSETLVQDSVNDLSLVSSEGKALWKVAIGNRIVTDVSQVDFFANGKLQYAFATSNTLHVVDRLGNDVNPFPIALPNSEIEHLTVVDYDNSKRYRFLLSDTKGRLWMYDKDGKLLEGWSPKTSGGALVCAPRHHRIKGKDYVLALRTDGKAVLTSRRGETLPRFPLDLEGEPVGDYYLDIGSSVRDTYFIVITKDGYRVKFTIDGKIQSRELLIKNSVTSKFSMVSDKNGKGYVILQDDGRQTVINDATGKKMITIAAGVTSTDVKYCDYGSGRVYIGVKDRLQSFVYVYDGSGNLLTTPPLESWAFDFRPGTGDSLVLFSIFKDQLTTEQL